MEKWRSLIRKWQWIYLIPANIVVVGSVIWFLALKPYPVRADSPALWQEMKQSRKVSIGIQNGMVVAKCWVAAEPAEFTQMLLDVEHYPQMFPTIPKMKKLSGGTNEAAAAGTIRAIGPITVSFAFNLKAAPVSGGAFELKWDGTGTGLGANSGTWEVQPFEGGSAVTNRIRLVPDGKLVPLGAWNRLMVPFVRHSLSFLEES